jgi:hypothetical protein
MARTPEQKAADEQLREAVLAARAAYGMEAGGVVSDILVIGAEHYFEGGDPTTSVFTLTGGELALYRILGLLDFAQAIYRHDAADGSEPA